MIISLFQAVINFVKESGPMKSLTIALIGMLGLAGTAYADDDAAARLASRCINVAYIDHTQIIDDNTILFHLRGGETLRNTLIDKCVGLRMASRGFTYVARNNEVCGNMQSIKLNDTGAICLLGSFSEEPPPKPH